MSYTPTNWQTGDTITAEKLNKMDNGWSEQETQMFSEMVTTQDTGQGYAEGSFTYTFQQDPPTTAIITYDNSVFTLTLNEFFGYGEAGATGPDFSHYPFYIYVDGTANIFTETAGTHTVTFASVDVEVGSRFVNAVSRALNASGQQPLLLKEGITTRYEFYEAFNKQQIIYFVADGIYYVSKALGNDSVKFTPESNLFTADFSGENGTFRIVWN